MSKKLLQNLLLFALVALPLSLLAQATIPVSGTKVTDNNGNLLTGQLVFTVTDTTGAPVTYTPLGGSPTTATITIPTLRGVVQNVGGFPPQIPYPATMSPANTRYQIQVQTTGGGTTYLDLVLTNITQAFFAYDAYSAPPAVTINGIGLPKLPCTPTALYHNNSASDVHDWVCSIISQSQGGSIYWTQNPSENPACQTPGQAVVSPPIGTVFCTSSMNAYVTPGLVLGGPPSTATVPGPVTVVPVSSGASLPANVPVIASNGSGAGTAATAIGIAGLFGSGPTGCVLAKDGTCVAAGGSPAGSAQQAQFNAGGAFGASKATFDAPGNFVSLSSDGLRNAFLNQTAPGANNGIQQSLQVVGNDVVAGPDYPFTEGAYGGVCGVSDAGWRDSIGCPPPFANNTVLLDYRTPGLGSYAYNTNMGTIGGFWRADRWVSNQQAQTTGNGSSIFPYLTDYENSGSGKNGFEDGGPDTAGYSENNFELMRRGIFGFYNIECQCYSQGDTHIWQNDITNNRGNPDGSAEAFNTVRNQIHQNLTPMVATANSTLAAGATLIPGTLVSPVPFVGDGTTYINASKGSALFHITAASDPSGSDAGQLTVDTLTLAPDNIGRVALPLSVPKQYYGATTNETITVTGLTSAITTGSTVCYADHAYMESARVVSAGSFSAGTQTGLVLALRYTHAANAYITQGSHACTAIDIRANQFPGTFKGRQILRIIGALDATHLLYSRIGFGFWRAALSGYASTITVAPAGATLTRNGSNVVSVAVSDPFLLLSKDDIIVSGCADSSFNGLFALTSDNSSTVTWSNTGSAGTTTCTNAVEVQSILNGLSVRQAQLFPAVEIVNTNDPVTFKLNYNISVEPNTNFQVTAGDQLEDGVYSEVGQGLDHNVISFKSQVSPSTADIIHADQLDDQIPEGTIWTHVVFQDAAFNYVGLGGTKQIFNVLFSMANNATPFHTLFDQMPAPSTALFDFSGCLYGCADTRSNFRLFGIPSNNGFISESVHQDTGLLDTTTSNATNRLTVQESPAGFSLVSVGVGGGSEFFAIPTEVFSTVGGGFGTFSSVDLTSSTIVSTVNGTAGLVSHTTQTPSGWTSDVPITVPSCTGCGGGVTSINATPGAFTFNFSAGAGSCSGTTCTFTGSGTGGGSVTDFIASSASWPTWLVPTVSLSTTTPTLAVAASAIPNSALANTSTTVNGQTCTLGSTCAIPNVTSGAAGLAPASGGGTTNFLRADGTWAVPAGGGGGISGLTAGFIPLAGSATTLTGNSHLDDGVTTVSTITSTEPVTVAVAGQASAVALSYSGTAPSIGSSTTAVYAVDASGHAETSEAGAAYSRICTAANGVCTPSGTAGGDLSGSYPNPTVAAVHATSGTIDGVPIGGITPAAATLLNLDIVGPGGLTNGLINFGLHFGTTAIKLFDGGSGNSYGWGLNGGEMQFYISNTPTSDHFSWNTGGDFQPSGTNEMMRLSATGDLSIGTTTDCGTLLGIGSGCPFKVDTSGNTSVATIAGAGTATIAPGATAQVGTGAAAVCATGHVCDSLSGTVTLTTGTGVLAAGTIATVTFPSARTSSPNCPVSIEGGTTFLAGSHSTTTTQLVFSDGIAAAISTTYTLTYNCGGK